MEPVKIAVIGAGLRGTQHLETLVRLTDTFELVGIAEQDPERADRARRTYGAPVFQRPDEMLDEVQPDVVDIIVPPDGHLPMTALAADRGVHVLVETPIAPTLVQTDAMIDVCEREGVFLQLAENVWRFPNERLKKQAIEAGLLGDVINVQLFYRSGSYHGMNVIHTHIGRGPSRVIGHARSLKRRVDFEPAEDVRPVSPSYAWEIGVFDFPNGATAVYQFPPRSERGNYWEIIGTAGSFVGTEAVFYGDSAPTSVSIEAEMDGETIVALRLPVEPEVRWENPFAKYGVEGQDGVALADLYMTMHAAATEARSPDYGGAGGRLDQEMLIGVRESASNGGKPLEFPLTETTAYERRLLQQYERKYGADALDTSPEAWRTLYPRQSLKGTFVE